MVKGYYYYPKLGRSGLGNCLLPWARAVIAARRHSLPMLAPRWVQPRLGAVLRRERVKRFYFNEFTNRGYVNGLRRAFVLATSPKLNEDAVSADPAGPQHGKHKAVVVFEGLRDYFKPLWDHAELVREELLKIVSPRIVEEAFAERDPFVAMHIRRGDIISPGFTEQQLLADRRYTPVSWYAAAATAINADPELRILPIFVVSDGRELELAELLKLPNCRFVTQGTAIGDILLLSKAWLLLASAHSTFSMWASYLGRMPTLYFPGKMDQHVFPPGTGIFEGEWVPGQRLPSANAETLKR